MTGRVEDVCDRPHFDDAAEIHHDHVLTEQAHDIEIMRHEQVAHAEPLPEFVEETQDHRLKRDVERRVGSSRMRSLGRTAMARAMLTRAL